VIGRVHVEHPLLAGLGQLADWRDELSQGVDLLPALQPFFVGESFQDAVDIVVAGDNLVFAGFAPENGVFLAHFVERRIRVLEELGAEKAHGIG